MRIKKPQGLHYANSAANFLSFRSLSSREICAPSVTYLIVILNVIPAVVRAAVYLYLRTCGQGREVLAGGTWLGVQVNGIVDNVLARYRSIEVGG